MSRDQQIRCRYKQLGGYVHCDVFLNGKAGTLVFAEDDMPQVMDALRADGKGRGMSFYEDIHDSVRLSEEPEPIKVLTTDGDGFGGQDMTFDTPQTVLYRMLAAGVTLCEYAVFLQTKHALAAIYDGADDLEAESLIQQLNDRGVRLVLDGPS